MKILYLGKVSCGVINLADVFREIGWDSLLPKVRQNKLEASLKLAIRYEENWDTHFSR